MTPPRRPDPLVVDQTRYVIVDRWKTGSAANAAAVSAAEAYAVLQCVRNRDPQALRRLAVAIGVVWASGTASLPDQDVARRFAELVCHPMGRYAMCCVRTDKRPGLDPVQASRGVRLSDLG